MRGLSRRRYGIGKAGKVAGIMISLLMLAFFASLLPGIQKSQQASNAAVRQACINLYNATANFMAIPGAWSGLNATEQQTGLSQLKTCLSEGYIQSIPSPGQSSSSATSSSSTASFLYFQVSCTGCGGGLANIVTYFPGVNASAALHSQYYGYYDCSLNGQLFNQPLPPSNGTQTFRIEPIYGSTFADWGFERMTANGTLQVQLMSSNGTLIYQGSATGSNNTVFSP